MANVINKTTFKYLQSVNTPDYMDGNWIINPTQQELADMLAQKKAIDDAQYEANKRYVKKTRAAMLHEVWKSVTPILEDITVPYSPISPMMHDSGYESGDVIILVHKDTPEQLIDKTERKTRYLALMNNHPIVPSFLEDGAYNDCREYLQSLIGSVITQEDYNYFDTVIPLQR
jgi:hypothetical protein